MTIPAILNDLLDYSERIKMTIPAILNDLLDYEDYKRRIQNDNRISVPTYIWVKKGKKEEAWAACALLGMVIDGDLEVEGHSVANTYIFAPMSRQFYASKYKDPSLYAIGVEGRFHLKDLQTYFEQWETNDVYNQPDRT